MNESSLNQRVSGFLIEKVGKLWGNSANHWDQFQHPEYARLAGRLKELLREEFGEEAVTRATAELLCYDNQIQEIEWWMACPTWKKASIRLRVGFGCWVWQASYPSDLARDLFAGEFVAESAVEKPGFFQPILASHVLTSWLGEVLDIQPHPSQPLRTAADPRGLDLIQGILQEGLLPWTRQSRRALYARALVHLKTAERLDIALFRHALNLEPQLALAPELYQGSLQSEFWQTVFEFTTELTEENSPRFCYFPQPTGARWILRACENVERLGLSTLASKKADAYDRNHAIRKIADIKAFDDSDNLEAFQNQLSGFSHKTRRLVAGCSPVARKYLLADPALPSAFEPFKRLFLSCNREIHIYFDNSPDPTNGVIPVTELRQLADELGELGRAQMLEEFAQLGSQGTHAVILLKGLFGLDRAEIEASIGRLRQSALKAYGLLPLPAAASERARELAARYAQIQAFARETEKLEAGRRLNGLAAVRVALTNLARLAGFPSVLALELELTTPVENASLPSLSHDSCKARIVLTSSGPTLAFEKNGRSLKSPPPTLKKLPEFKALQTQHSALCAQLEHFKARFEEMMTSERPIAPGEFSQLLRLPVARWLMERLLLSNGDKPGLVDPSGTALNGLTQSHPIRGESRIVHPLSLSADQLAAWQEKFTALGLEPPFAQLLRESYRLQNDETQLTECTRFADIRIKCDAARQQLARRGWSEGEVDYAFFYKGYCSVRAALIPGDDLERLPDEEDFRLGALNFSPIERPYFHHFSPLPLKSVPAIVFSEAVRDLTLLRRAMA